MGSQFTEKMKNPLVSVNIRTYNSGKTLAETLQSVKDQTYKNIEILVSDGYSKDDSVSIAKKYGATVRYADKLGDARHQNYENSKGKYILSLDSDQVLDKQVISECVKECEDKGYDALTIAEKSIIDKGTFLQKLIAYDKWVIDQKKDADVNFGTACPRFFKKELLKNIKWPKELSVFDDTILYAELIKQKAKINYMGKYYINHHEVSSWIIFAKKFFRYGKGYFGALKEKPSTIAAHSLPRRSYFSKAAFSKPEYFVGLMVLYIVKATAASFGVISYLLESKKSAK